MDKDKFKIFKSGRTEEEQEVIAKNEAVEAIFEKEQGSVRSTMRSKGFKIILDKVIGEMERTRLKLITCKEKDLARLQAEVKVRKEFLDIWSPYNEM